MYVLLSMHAHTCSGNTCSYSHSVRMLILLQTCMLALAAGSGGGYARRRSAVSVKWMAEQMVKHTTLFAWPGAAPDDEEEEEERVDQGSSAYFPGDHCRDNSNDGSSFPSAAADTSATAGSSSGDFGNVGGSGGAARQAVHDPNLLRPLSAQEHPGDSDEHPAAPAVPPRKGGNRVSFARVSGGPPALVVGRVRWASSSSAAMYRASMRRASVMWGSHNHSQPISHPGADYTNDDGDGVPVAVATPVVTGSDPANQGPEELAGQDSGSDSGSVWEEVEGGGGAGASDTDPCGGDDSSDPQQGVTPGSDLLAGSDLGREASVLGFLASILVPCTAGNISTCIANDSSTTSTCVGTAMGKPPGYTHAPGAPPAGIMAAASGRLQGVATQDLSDMTVSGIPAIQVSVTPSWRGQVLVHASAFAQDCADFWAALTFTWELRSNALPLPAHNHPMHGAAL
jgi:hypothetical protein